MSPVELRFIGVAALDGIVLLNSEGCVCRNEHSSLNCTLLTPMLCCRVSSAWTVVDEQRLSDLKLSERTRTSTEALDDC